MGDLSRDVAAFGERVARMSAGDIARHVESIARSSTAMLACAAWLAQHPGDRRVADACGAAREIGLRVAELMLDDAPPQRALAPRARRPLPGLSMIDKRILRAPIASFRPLAMRAGLRARLTAITVHPNADHTRRLLAEPALMLADVVAMCARRPTTAEILVEIAACERWVRHAEVREALVMNPFTPASIATRLVPTLPIVRRARDAPAPRVREMAKLLSATTMAS